MQRLSLKVYGTVQGVGFRPFVKNLADRHKLNGWVQNTPSGVRIEIEGIPPSVECFLKVLRRQPPVQAKIDRIELQQSFVDNSSVRPTEFIIRKSAGGIVQNSFLPPDIATCEACLGEIMSPNARRYRYPFTNCAECGPRFSIVTRLPYDRGHTSMHSFPMCSKCEAEYNNPKDRRYHAQAIACPACGPQLTLFEGFGTMSSAAEGAMDGAVDAIRNGRIVAIKALGGFQLCVDATNNIAVSKLRKRKQRPDKPFAILCRSLEEVKKHCLLSTAEAELLTSPAAPISLLRKLKKSKLAESVAPENPRLGVMLAYTPLHHILLDALSDPLVCTSGNLSEEPICIEIDEALIRLVGIADCFLSHNRPVARPIDDSVAQINDGCTQILRRARGYAPLPIPRHESGPCILACGGQQKSTVALTLGRQVVLSQHIGNLNTPEAVDALKSTMADLTDFFHVRPDVVACDLHPDYSSTAIAAELAIKYRAPLQLVQHHHAHTVACMAEHQLAGPVLSLCWDGTGYGDDGKSWGGEALVCTFRSYNRKVCLRPFGLLGGEQAIRDPRRIALSMALQVFRTKLPGYLLDLFTGLELRVFKEMLAKFVNCPESGGMGRLFDAVAVLAGIQDHSTFDGHAAMSVQTAAERETEVSEDYDLPLDLTDDNLLSADWRPMLFQIHEDRMDNIRPGVIAARFHNTLASLAARIALNVGLSQVVLSGGCFQNVLLTKKVSAALRQAGFQVHNHRNVPPNDGGLAMGQALIAASRVGIGRSE